MRPKDCKQCNYQQLVTYNFVNYNYPYREHDMRITLFLDGWGQAMLFIPSCLLKQEISE